jgi:hypothetical protein
MPDKVRYDTGSDAGKAKVLPESYVPKPLWQRFPGFSFLFNNPGDSLKRFESYETICIDTAALKRIDLYAQISEAVDRIDPSELAQRFHFFALPPSTYHVTVWDGINKGNADRLSPETKWRFDHDYFLRNIGETIHAWPPFAEIGDYTKWFKDVGTIRLRYRGLRARGNTVLIAELEPDPNHSDSLSVFTEIRRRRGHLDECFAQHGKPENYDLRPHVAIGYFSNPDLGYSALYRHMDTWMSIFNEISRTSVIEFREIDLYAFIDMVTYFKPIKT